VTDTTRTIVSPIGSSFESFLEEDGLLETVDEAAVKEVIAWQVAQGMKGRGLTKAALASAMHTSRTQVDRLLDPANTGVALHTLYRAAAVLGKKLKIELVDRDDAEENVDAA
jgi:antitoxin HicB